MLNSEAYCVYVIDVETSGRNVELHDILELSAIRSRSQMDGSFEREQKTWYLKSVSGHIEDEALRINGHKREDILWQTEFGRNRYREPAEVVVEIEQWILEDDCSALDRIFAGQNPKFDLDFCQALWKRNDAAGSFPFAVGNDRRLLDTQQVTLFFDICTGKRRLAYNLGGLVKSFEIKKGKAHQAEEDTRMTADLLEKQILGVQEVVREKFGDCYKGG